MEEQSQLKSGIEAIEELESFIGGIGIAITQAKEHLERLEKQKGMAEKYLEKLKSQ